MLAASACGDKDTTSADPQQENEYLEGLPEQAALELRLTEDVGAEALATAADAIVEDDAAGAAATSDALGSLQQALEAEAAPGVARTAEAVRDLNQALRNFLQPIVALARNTEPTLVERNVAMWGPVTRGVTEYRLFVKRGVLRRYGWLLQARPEGDAGEFANVAAGDIQVGTRVRRGRGTVGVDLDALGEVDPTVAARGKVLASFAHGPLGTALAYALKDFTRDAEDSTPIAALFQGVHLSGGLNRVRLAFYGNVPETATDAEEFVLARVRHQRGEGGRADMLVAGGDVEQGRLFVVSECWSGGLASAYRIVRDCPGDGIGDERCVVVNVTGDASACPAAVRTPEFPPANAEEPMD